MMLLARRYSVQRHSLPLLEFLEVRSTPACRYSYYYYYYTGL
jgi:hypothetical protein